MFRGENRRWLPLVRLICALACLPALQPRAHAEAPDAAVRSATAPNTLVPAAVVDTGVDPLVSIRARVIAGDTDAALALLSTLPAERAATPELRYLAARLHERRGKIKDALAVLPSEQNGLSTLPAPVVQDALTRRALWLSRSGECGVARPQLVSILASAPSVELTMAAAQCALNDSDVASALALLHGVKGPAEKNFAIRFLLARALAQSGDRAGAARTLRELYVERPEHVRAGEIEPELVKLGEKPVWTDEQRLQRAQSWLAALEPDDALTELDKLHAPKAKALRARVLHLRGMALFKLRSRYAEAAKILAQASAIPDSDTQGEDAFHAAQALARADRDAEAVRSYRAFVKRFPQHELTPAATHAAAWLELRHDLPGGESHMRAFLADAEKKPEQRDEAQQGLWELAFYLFERAQYDRALPLFERYAKTSDSTMIRARGTYWQARAALLAGQRELALQRWRETLGIEPLHWYALLAQSRLAALGVATPDPFAAPISVSTAVVPQPSAASELTQPQPVPAVPFVPPQLALPPEVELYSRLGLVDDAESALKKAEPSLRAGLSDEVASVALCAAYQRIEDYAHAYKLAEGTHAGAIRQRPLGLTRAYWDALFPRPYLDDVQLVTQQNALPDDFVYAIMRKESAYDPSVVSSANAVGLLQLIEPTAKTIANELGLAPWKRQLLFQPSINVRLGARYLADLLWRYHGQAVPAIAAYNAGEHRVSAWLARGERRYAAATKTKEKRVELDRFVEDIPIEQTRNYVRRVVANWARYRYLAHPETPWPVTLPEHLSSQALQ